MTTFSDGLREGLRSAACTLVGGRPEWLGQYLDWGTPSGLAPIARNLRRWVCDAPPDEPVTLPPPPFTGGQCPVDYRVQVQSLITTQSGSTVNAISGLFILRGPITGLGSAAGGAACGGSTKPAAAVFHNGQTTIVGCPGSAQSIVAVGFEVLERVDGMADDCGDPPPILPPPAPINVDVDITYGDNNEFNLTVPVIFAPLYVALDGSINAPVTVNLDADFQIEGTLELFPGFEFTPTINFGGDTGDGQPDPEPPPDDPEGPGEPEEDDPNTPKEPDDRIYALLCRGRIESDARPSGIFQQIGPDIYAPRLGSARFGTEIEGVTFWSEDIDIKGLNSVVQCPIPWGASRFVVNAAPGVSLNYTPVSSAPKEWPPFIQLGAQFTSDNR